MASITGDKERLFIGLAGQLLIVNKQSGLLTKCIPLKFNPKTESETEVASSKEGPTDKVAVDSTENGAKKTKDSPQPQCLCMTVHPTSDYLAVATNSKQVFVYPLNNVETPTVISIPKQATALQFSDFGVDSKIIVADRQGNVIVYPVDQSNVLSHSPRVKEEGETKADVLEAEEVISNGGRLLLGHVSLLLDLKLNTAENYLVTSDRDAKIRVSRYPNCYTIQSFCLGHRSYVKSLAFLSAIPKTHDEILLSASGDGCIKCWRCEDGQLLASCELEGKREIRTMVTNCKSGLVVICHANQPLVSLLQLSHSITDGYCLSYFDEMDLSTVVASVKTLWDCHFDDDSLWLLTDSDTNPLVRLRLPSLALDMIPVGTEVTAVLSQWISRVRDELPPLAKAASSGNYEKYLQTKEQKIGRKRKLADIAESSA